MRILIFKMLFRLGNALSNYAWARVYSSKNNYGHDE